MIPIDVVKAGFRKPAALLLGNYRPTLVIARELQARGFRIIAGLEGCDRGAEYSRHVDEIWQHTFVSDNPARFVEELEELLETRTDIALVVPVSEQSVRLFAERRVHLPAGVHLVANEEQLVKTCLDKTTMLALARDCKVPVAPFRMVGNLVELSAACQELGFPLVVRPMHSTRRLFGKKAIVLESKSCLKKWFGKWPPAHRELLIQSRAPGIRHNIYFAANEGVLCQYLHARIDRTDRLDGSGLAVDGKTVSPDPTLFKYTSDLIGRLDYTGIGCAQYLVDQDTGQTIFLEVNPRFAGNHAVPEYCGLTLTDFLLQLAAGKPVDVSLKHGRSGVRYSWVAGDLEGLKSALRDREIGLLDSLVWIRNAITTASGANIDMMFNRRDLKPALAGLLKVVPGMRHIMIRSSAPASRPSQGVIPGARSNQ